MADHLKLNFEYRTLIQENEALIDGFQAGISTLCQKFYGKEILEEDLYRLSTGEGKEDALVKKVVFSLQNRVKNNTQAFPKIVEVLHMTTSMGYLAERLENRLAILQEEHKKQAERVMREREKGVLVAHPELQLQYKRPTTFSSNFRRVEEAYHTEPAKHKQMKSPQSLFQDQAQASSVGSIENRFIADGSPGYGSYPPPPLKHDSTGSNTSLMQPIEKTHDGRKHSHALLEIGHTTGRAPMGTSPPLGRERVRECLSTEREDCVRDTGVPSEAEMDREIPQMDRTQPQEEEEELQTEHVSGTEPTGKTSNNGGSGNDASFGPSSLENSWNEGSIDPPYSGSEHASVPESHSAKEKIKFSYITVQTQSSTCNSMDSSEKFVTPPNSPPAVSSPKLNPLEEKRTCAECYHMRRKTSLLEMKLNDLAISREREAEKSEKQIEVLKHELCEVEQQKYEAKTRHRMQKDIISKLSAHIHDLEEEINDREGICFGDCEHSRDLKKDLEKEREWRERERVEKEREKCEKDRERKEKEEEVLLRRAVQEENMKLKKKNYELEMKMKHMYREIKRANSLQCDDKQEAKSEDYQNTEQYCGNGDRLSEPAASYTTQQPPGPPYPYHDSYQGHPPLAHHGNPPPLHHGNPPPLHHGNPPPSHHQAYPYGNNLPQDPSSQPHYGNPLPSQYPSSQHYYDNPPPLRQGNPPPHHAVRQTLSDEAIFSPRQHPPNKSNSYEQ